MVAFKYFLVILPILAAWHCVESTKLNYPRILLPIFDKISVNFTLEVIEAGCHKWTSSRQDLIQISPQYDDLDSECSSRAVVTVLTKDRRRNTAIVLAEDISTSDVLRCDVILDIIDQFAVITTTRELYLEEAPETFELMAQDSQGNAFTTLEGVEFTWTISSSGNSDRNDNWLPALRFLKFTESKYHEVPPALERFENANIKGYMVLLEGINTGTAKVTVHLAYPEYSHIKSNEVHITVLANIILDPSDVNIMVGDSVNFRVLQLKNGKLEEVKLSGQYYFEVEDTQIASIISTQTAKGLKLGRTGVVLRDRNVPQDSDVKAPVPRATLTICAPSKITINLLPHYNWITVEGENHEIAIDLWNRDEQKILIGSKYYLHSKIDVNLFSVRSKTKNGSRLIGTAVQEGTGLFEGSFNDLIAFADLQVFKDLEIYPRKVFLPLDASISKTQKFQFLAQGGDGNYNWASQNPSILQISQSGLASTRVDSEMKIAMQLEQDSVVLKHTLVKVALTKNTKIFRTAEVFFLPPVKLEIVKYNFETALRDYVKIFIGLSSYVNGSYVPLSKCENLNFDLEFSNQIFHAQIEGMLDQPRDTLPPNACHLILLKSVNVGVTNLKVSYKFMDKILSDEATLYVFERLNVLNPAENLVVLPIGASRNVIYVNGPQRIFNLEADLTKTVNIDENVASISEIESESFSASNVYAFTVLCRKIGETSLNFKIFNTLSSSNFHPYVSEFVTKVFCVKPRFINLYATEKLRHSCPIEMKNSLIHLKEHGNDGKFEIQIEIEDSKNQKLMNISSLIIEWEYAQSNGKFKKDFIFSRQTEELYVENVRIPNKNVLVVSITEVVSSFKIKGIVTKYDQEVLSSYEIEPEYPEFGIKRFKDSKLSKPVIENEIKFLTVNSSLFPEKHISVFLAKNSLVSHRLLIKQGSGFFDFEMSESGVFTFEFNQENRELIIIPRRIGNASLKLFDRCLMTEPAELSVSVVAIGLIKIDVLDKVEKSKVIEAIVKLYDSNDNLLEVDRNNLRSYDLQEHVFESHIFSVRLADQDDLNAGEIRYFITGLELGESKFTVSSGSVTSEPTIVQVFSPLRLLPRNSTIVVGSSIQLYHQGGPHPDVNIIYSVEQQSIASMESAVISGIKVGSTRIIGKCVGINPNTGSEIIFSEDSVEVHVVPIESIKIRTPLTRIKSGATIPATIWGLPELSPMVLGTLQNMRVIWSTNQPSVVDIYNIFSEAGIDYTDKDLIAVRIKAMNPGKAKIQAIAILPTGQRFTSTVEITVFKTLEIVSPKSITMDSILIPPRTSINLKANLEDVTYKLDADASGIVTVSSNGAVKSKDSLGRDMIIAKTFEQTLPIDIEVKNIQYIMASLLPYPSIIKLKQTEEKIPKGMNFVLKISLHDNLGNEFSHNLEDVNSLRVELSHKDIIDAQIGHNLTVMMSLPHETNGVIAIGLKDSTSVKFSEDYVKLSVTDSTNLFPAKTIFSVGDIICFESPLSSTSNWHSSDERLLSIDKFTGVGKVLGHRFKLGEKVVVSNGDKNSNSIKYDIEVRDADQISFIKVSDVFSGSTYRADLLIRNHIQVEKTTNLIAKNLSKCANFVENVPTKFFTCRLSTRQLQFSSLTTEHYKVTEIFDREQGTYSCRIDLVTSLVEVMAIAKTYDIVFEVEAKLFNGLSDVAALKFIPGIKVNPDAMTIDEVSQQNIVITGLDKVLQKVEVKSSDSTLFEIKQQTKTHGSLQYKIKVLNEIPSETQMFIYVHSPLTLQDIEIPILGPNAFLQHCANQPFENSSELFFKIASNIGIIISFIIVGVSIIWAFVYCYPPKNKCDVNNEVFNVTKLQTADKSNVSSISNLSQSPLQLDQSRISPSSPFNPNTSSGSGRISPRNLSSGNEWPVYGDGSFISPQRRINRRYL